MAAERGTRSVPPAQSAAFTLELRHRPIRKRGIERFAAILAAGRGVLVEAGLEGFTMEDVAARARVPVGSVYQYFPNKFALVAELAAQDTAAIVAGVNASAGEFPADDWQEQVDRLIDHMAQEWAADPWRAAVYTAMRSTAATRVRAAQDAQAVAEAVTGPLTALTATLDDEQRKTVALVIVETCQPLLNLTVQHGDVDPQILSEVKRLARAYLRAVALGSA